MENGYCFVLSLILLLRRVVKAQAGAERARACRRQNMNHTTTPAAIPAPTMQPMMLPTTRSTIAGELEVLSRDEDNDNVGVDVMALVEARSI
jgi:hypothetical protein